MELCITSHSHDETIRLGRALGQALQGGSVVGLIGELGAGKTCFVKGLANGISRIPEDEVTSPTFTIIQEYPGTTCLYHCDAYRLAGEGDLDAIGFEDCMDGDTIVVIEWADRIIKALPGDCLIIDIDVITEDSRRFTLKAAGKQYEKALQKLRSVHQPAGKS